MARIYEDKCAQIKIDGDLIYGIIYSENLSLSCAEKMVDFRYKVTRGKPYAMIIDISRLKTVTKEARDYLANGRAAENISAVAIYTTSPVAQLAANFFLNYNKPDVPAKIFQTQEEALAWVKEVTAKNDDRS